jgi:hypothetical protein
LIGQSNAQGSTGKYPDEYLKNQPHRFSCYVYGGSAIEYLNTNLTNVGTIWGAELSAGTEITENPGRQVAFIKVTKGSTSMAVNWQKGGNMYSNLVSTYTAAVSNWIDAGYTPRLREVWVMQGESDSINAAYSTNWAANATQFKSDFESDLKVNAPWVVARINTTNPSWTYGAQVQAQQDLFGSENPNVTVFSTDDLPMKTNDLAHYTSDGQVTLGERFVSASYLSKDADTTAYYTWRLPLEESGGVIAYDTTLNEKNGTITGPVWTNIYLTASCYYHTFGGVTWSSGSTNVYVPNTLAGVPATNNVAGFTVARTNLTGMVHNRGPYSLYFGGITNTYSMMLTNSVSITTNATGQIRSYAK